MIPKNELAGEGVGSCPLCGGSEYVVDWKYQNKSYVHCRQCGLAFVTPLAGNDASHAANGNSSETKHSYSRMMRNRAEVRGKYSAEMGARRVEQCTRLLGRAPRTILEIGAGDGAFSYAYEALGIEYVGLDVNPVIVEVAQALGRKVELGGIERVQALGKQYDIVFSSQSLEHILEPVALLKHVGVLLKPDGILHLDVPNHAGLASMLRRVRPHDGEYGFLQPPHHQIAYTPATLERLLRETGFAPTWIRAFGNTNPTWGQLTVTKKKTNRIGMELAGKIGMGSILVALARPRN